MEQLSQYGHAQGSSNQGSSVWYLFNLHSDDVSSTNLTFY